MVVRNGEAFVYDLTNQNLNAKVNERDRMISEIVYQKKRHLGVRGMIEDALVIAREMENWSGS